jgi:hypothetical protein
MNHMLHIAAATQVRLDTEGRAYYRGKLGGSRQPRGLLNACPRPCRIAMVNDVETRCAGRHTERGLMGRLPHIGRRFSVGTSTFRGPDAAFRGHDSANAG